MSILPPATQEAQTPTPTSVYLYYDQHNILIYVGITSRGVRRNLEHNTTKDWWQFVRRQEVEHYLSRPEALAREKALIQKHSPPFNIQHNRAADKIRSAYILFAAATSQPVALRDAVRAMQQRIELDPHELGDPLNIVLRTRVDDAQVTAALQLPEGGEMPRVFGLKGKNISKVRKIEQHGPITLLHLGQQWRHPILDAYAHIRFDAKQRLVLRNVHVRLDHTSGEACNRKCPQVARRPKVQWIRPDGSGAA